MNKLSPTQPEMNLYTLLLLKVKGCVNQAYRMEQPPHPSQVPDVQDNKSANPYPETGYTEIVEYAEYRNTGATYQVQDGQSTNPYLETGYVNAVDYPEYRNTGPIYEASSSCSFTEPIYTEPPTTDSIYAEPATA